MIKELFVNSQESQGQKMVRDTVARGSTRPGLPTIVLVTHEPDIAAVARRVIMMKDGVVLSDRPARVAGDQLIFQPTI